MKNKIKQYPLVSVCTPTYNRRPFIETMFKCFRNQTYPKHRIEWIIVDDGTDKIKDLVIKSEIEQIRYYEVEDKMVLGAKRNYMHEKCNGSIIVYMDDDDYYPPDRISHAVETLLNNDHALCAGSSEIYVYFKHVHKMIQCGPYGKSHATAGTFAFKKKLLNITKYDDTAAIAEESAFLKNYKIPFVQLDPLKTILVFSHEHNTYDKRKMFNNANPKFFKESPKTVDTFIKYDDEKDIKQFFMEDIDELLKNYEPGLPMNKPDVLKQIKKIEDDKDKAIKEYYDTHKNKPIILQQQGQSPKELNNIEVTNIIRNLQTQVTDLTDENNILKKNKPIMIQQPNEEAKILNNNEVTKFISNLQTQIKNLTDENHTLKKYKPIILNIPNQEPKILDNNEVVNMINELQLQVRKLTIQNKELNINLLETQNKFVKLSLNNSNNSSNNNNNNNNNKIMPDILVDITDI